MEIAPGIDLKSQVLGLMDFEPIISKDLKVMDERLFNEGTVGMKEWILEKSNI